MKPLLRSLLRYVLPALLLPLSALWLWLAWSPAPPLLDGVDFSSLVTDREGRLLRMALSHDEKYRVYTRLQDISPEAHRATLLYEDKYFYLHPGINVLSLGRAALGMLAGGRRMGGSTITMQVARLRYGLRTAHVAGKLEQIGRALQLEYHYAKDQILEAYFNLAPYGGNVEGLGAAARIYFRTTPGRLTLTESLALAVIPQNPVLRSPLRSVSTNKNTRRGEEAPNGWNQARARLHGLWSASTPGSVPSVPPPLRVHAPEDLPFAAPHAVTRMLLELPPGTGTGHMVRSFVDLSLQRILERAVADAAARGQRLGLHNAAALLLHWPSNEIRALAGSADFHNPTIEGQVDGTQARRSPGSTLKPFIYALALEQGLIHPQTLLADTPRAFAGYVPENFDQTFKGPLPAHQALRSSRNVPAVYLASRLQPDLYTFLHQAGVRLPFAAEHYGLSLVLGGAEVSARELADIYAMLANKGIWRASRLHPGEPESPSRALLSPESAILTLRMLEDENHLLRTSQGTLPLRFKTGTSNGFRDAWTAGVVGPYVLVVWLGNFDNTPNPHLVGAQAAIPVFMDIVQNLARREPLRDLIPAQQEGLNIIRIPTCTATGDTDTSLCADTTPTWYIPGRSPTRASGVFRTLLLDTATGLRACRPEPGRTQEVVWEFWPTDLQKLFARAGVIKPSPPPFLPQCRPDAEESLFETSGDITQPDPTAGRGAIPYDDATPPGLPPRILEPREGVVYQHRLSTPERGAIALRASVDADAATIFWFAGNRYLGSSKPEAPLRWLPPPGVHMLRAVDDLGRASRLRVVVKTTP